MITDKKEILAYWLKNNKIKEYKNKTLTEMSEELDVSQGYLSNILNGNIGMYLYRLVQIAEVLNVKPADLLPDEWQSSVSVDKDKMYNNIAVVVEVVEEYLSEHNKKLKPSAKGELIASLCEVAASVDGDNEKKHKIVEFAHFALKRAL